MNRFSDATILVTGGAKRIGGAISKHLAEAGASVIIHANTDLDAAQNLADELGGIAVQADLSRPTDAERLVAVAAAAADRPVTHVVNNASAFLRQSFGDMDAASFDQMMHLHAYAPAAIARAAAQQGAQAVVNLLDTRITSHDPAHFAYLTSKQTLAALTRTLAKELAPMRVNGVAPGPILPANEADGASHDLQPAIDATVLGRSGRPEEVAQAVAFLLAAEYVTGDVLFVDGGRHLQ